MQSHYPGRISLFTAEVPSERKSREQLVASMDGVFCVTIKKKTLLEVFALIGEDYKEIITGAMRIKSEYCDCIIRGTGKIIAGTHVGEKVVMYPCIHSERSILPERITLFVEGLRPRFAISTIRWRLSWLARCLHPWSPKGSGLNTRSKRHRNYWSPGSDACAGLSAEFNFPVFATPMTSYTFIGSRLPFAWIVPEVLFLIYRLPDGRLLH